jgi:CubicO group peptidase (beta-lactamase class C family)
VLLATLALLDCRGRPAILASPDNQRWPGWSQATGFLDSVVADSAAPGAVLAVSWRGQRRYHGTGHLGTDDPTRPDSATLYDLASLTKVVGLTTLTMIAVSEGRLDLDTPVDRYVPAFAGPHKPEVTLRHLLTHSSGLPAWRPLYREATTRGEALALVDTTGLDTLPGVRSVYSDLGAIVLTQAVEAVMGHRVDTLLAQRVFGPLGMTATRYLPSPALRPRIAPTEDDPWRGRVLRGEVHDENAARLDGVSGHAGLFSDAVDLLVFGEWLLSEVNGERSTVNGGPGPIYRSPFTVHPSPVATFTRRQDLVPGSSRALGWDTPSDGSSAGTRLSPSSFGHTGFTGTSIWIDPERGLVIVLLSNRVHPTRQNARWGPIRGQVADHVVDALPTNGLSR